MTVKRVCIVCHLFMLPILLALLLFTEGMAAPSPEIPFTEKASDMMIEALKPEPDRLPLKQLYRHLFYIPLWIKQKNPSPLSRELFSLIHADKTLEKRTLLYQNACALEEEMHQLYDTSSTIVQKINWEFKMSQLYGEYANYRIYGSINWGALQARLSNLRLSAITAGWVTYKPKPTPAKVAEDALLSGSLSTAFDEAEPDKYHYRALKKALERYMEIKASGGWPSIGQIDGKLKPSMSHPSIPLIRQRLTITGEYQALDKNSGSTRYDTALEDAVIVFQKSNGLTADGIIGGKTLKALNQTVEARIALIKINLDRIKWLHKRRDPRHIIINIPDFRLYYEEGGELKMTMKVIVGRRKNPTPIFSNRVTSIVLNPYWNVPKSIIQKEMIPKLLRNPHAMAKQGIDIYNGWGADAKKISGSSIHWAQYRYSKTVPFRFAQRPGNKNALGRIKFLFPNQFHVYMHDTPTKHLFKRHTRAYSHGCIRLEKPKEMLKTIASFNPDIQLPHAEKILRSKKNSYLSLKHTVPVDIVYLTTWIDYRGRLQFRDDIYGYDALMLASVRRW